MIRRFVSVLLVVTVLGCGTPVPAWSLCIDGEPVDVTMPKGAGSFSKRVEAPVYQGYHTLAVSIAGRMGQTKSVSWPFATALSS
jgi:hypothetical protein